MRTVPGSPSQAVLRPKDIVIGPPGAPFLERNQIREWVATSAPGQVRTLEIMRRGARRRVEITAEPPPLDD
jgi:S1-C subfamily serine protease